MKPLLSAFFLLCSFCLSSQTKKIDSLLAVNAAYYKEDSLKVIYLTDIFRQYCRMDNMDKVLEFSDKAVEVAKKLPQTHSLTNVYELLGRCYHGKAKYLQALNAYNNGIAVAKAGDDKNTVAGLYMNLSALYGSIPDYTKSLEAIEQAVIIFNETDDKDQLSGCYMNMAILYNDVQNPVKAVEYIRKALPIFKEFSGGLNYGTPLAYQGLAHSYLIASDAELVKMGIDPAERYQQCLDNLTAAIKVAEQTEDASGLLGKLNSDIGQVYEKMGDKTSALKYYQAALGIIKSKPEQEEIGNILYAVGSFYCNDNDFVQSKMYLNQSLDAGNSSGELEVQQNALGKLSTVFEKTKQYDSALIYYQRYIAVRDSIFNEKKEKEITRKQLQLDFTIKENDYKLVQETDGKVKLLLLSGFLLVLAIAVLIFYNQRKTARLNTIINQQKISLEQLSLVKDKIFSVVSHDMRAPVNSLISFIDILENGKIAPGKLAIYANELKQNLSHTSALMNNLLNWAASQMQGFKPVKENVDVSAIVTEVAGLLQHHLQQKQVILKNNIPPGTIIHADPDMLAAILRNLISNAAKYSNKDGIITISCESTGDGYSLLVKDYGTGMQPIQLQAFNSHNQQQAESVRGTANEKGTGLGLLLCKTFTAQMGGKISATNDDQGMTFTVRLPATPAING